MARFLRNPKIIVGEIGLLTAAFVVSTIVPSAGSDRASVGTRADANALAVRLAGRLGLDHVFISPIFVILVALVMASLVVALKDQIGRAWRLWSRSPQEAGPSGAPYRHEEVFRGPVPPGFLGAEVRIRGAAGVWGSPLFHLGILLIVVAGIVTTLFGADAVVDLMAGETLLGGSQYGKQWPGLLARPFAFPVAVRLEELHVNRYRSGGTRWVEGTLRLGEGSGSDTVPIAINGPIRRGFHTLYLRAIGGAAALVEVQRGPDREKHAILLKETGHGAEGRVILEGGAILRASSNVGGIGSIPDRIDFRLLRDGALAGTVQLVPSEAATLADGTNVTLSGIVPWAQLSAKRDFATPIVYAGFLLACVGGLLTLALVRVESGAMAEAAPEGVKLTVWMRPQRFAPLFAPAFERFWKNRSAVLEAALKRSASERI